MGAWEEPQRCPVPPQQELPRHILVELLGGFKSFSSRFGVEGSSLEKTAHHGLATRLVWGHVAIVEPLMEA